MSSDIWTLDRGWQRQPNPGVVQPTLEPADERQDVAHGGNAEVISGQGLTPPGTTGVSTVGVGAGVIIAGVNMLEGPSSPPGLLLLDLLVIEVSFPGVLATRVVVVLSGKGSDGTVSEEPSGEVLRMLVVMTGDSRTFDEVLEASSEPFFSVVEG